MSVTDGIGQTLCSFEHYLVFFNIKVTNATMCTTVKIRKMLKDRAINTHIHSKANMEAC